MRSFGKIFPLVVGVAIVFFGLSIIFDIGFPFFRLLIGGLIIFRGCYDHQTAPKKKTLL
jgi:uncharacterized membrane protein